MADLLETGCEWLVGQIKAHASRTVSYHRGGQEMIASIAGTVSQHDYTLIDAQGVMVSVTAFDWTFAGEDFFAFGEAIRAQPGDMIVEVVGDVRRRYEVLPLADRPVQETLDPQGLIVLLHSKRIQDH